MIFIFCFLYILLFFYILFYYIIFSIIFFFQTSFLSFMFLLFIFSGTEGHTIHHETVNVSIIYFNKYHEFFVLCNFLDDLDPQFSHGCISELETVGTYPASWSQSEQFRHDQILYQKEDIRT